MAFSRCIPLFLLLLAVTTPHLSYSLDSPVKGKTICIDPGHGGTAETDHYRVGPTGEREEWVNLRVALILAKMLEERGAKVILTRNEDVFVPLTDRSHRCMEGKADLFLSIHHNATADSTVNFPIIYYHANASENRASVSLGKIIARELVKRMYKGKVSPEGNFVSLVSDYTIFPQAGASVLRNTYGVPAVLAEASFFTHHGEEQLLKTEKHNLTEAEAYLSALESFFKTPKEPILAKNSLVPELTPFKVFQEAERMTPIARRWKRDVLEAEELAKKGTGEALNQALELFTRSASSFPDSYLAGKCHSARADIFRKLGREKEAKEALLRSREYYVKVPGL